MNIFDFRLIDVRENFAIGKLWHAREKGQQNKFLCEVS